MTDAGERRQRIPTHKRFDPGRFEAWVSMNTVRDKNPSPGAEFIYIDDLYQGFDGNHVLDELPSMTIPLELGDYVEVLEVARELGVEPVDILSSALQGYLDGVRTARIGDLDEPNGPLEGTEEWLDDDPRERP